MLTVAETEIFTKQRRGIGAMRRMLLLYHLSQATQKLVKLCRNLVVFAKCVGALADGESGAESA